MFPDWVEYADQTICRSRNMTRTPEFPLDPAIGVKWPEGTRTRN